MSISVSTVNNDIRVVAVGGSVQAQLASPSRIAATVAGGQGPQGEPGTVTSLGGIQDVELLSISDGDILRYSSSRWRNHPETSLVDGGNF